MAEQHAHPNPFEGVTDYFTELNRMRHTGVHGREQSDPDRQHTHASAWVPAADIYVRGQDLVVALELAGIDPEEIHLGFVHGVLTVSGSRRAEPESEVGPFYVRERFRGEFRRAVTLPDGTERADIEAVFDRGLVEVTVRGGAQHPGTERIELRSPTQEGTRLSLG